MAVYDADETSLGHLDISVPGSWRKMSTCPQKSGQRYLVQFTGTTNVSYTAEIYDNVPNVTIGKEVSFEISTQSPQIFQFKPMKGISKTQLDVTVESDSTTSAYLKVSHTCREVTADGIKHLDYNGGSLRLSFAEKGRITLSRASAPPLEDSGSAWFIGIALKDDDANATKIVRLTLTKSFDYDYSGPFCFLIGTSFFGGIVVALWALLCFREPYILAHEDSQVDDSTVNSFSTSGTGFKANLKSLLSSCWVRNGGESDELRPLLRGSRDRTPLTWKEIARAMKSVLFHHWFSKGPKAFSYTTCIVGFVLLVGAFQFVFEDWHMMIQDGDRDKCFYNDLCYRVSGYDIPFNLMISNLAYMIHGLILCWSVWIMEAELLAWCQRIERRNRGKSPRLPINQVELPKHVLKCPNINAHLATMSVPPLFISTPEKAILLHAEAHKRKYTFSIGYAFAWGLIFEGCFSMLYHFCPTKLTFQFDAAFMFVISGLIVISLYNGMSFKECAPGQRIQQPVEASNFFLYFIVPLYVFNYFGSLYYSNTESLSVGMQIAFVLCLVAYYIIIFSWAGVKLFYNLSSWGDFRKCDVLTKAVIFVVTLALASIALPVLFKTNFPNIFLFSCILACLLAIIGKVLIKFWRSERSHYTFKKVAFRIFQGSYVLVTLGVMGTAVWIFSWKATTDKVKPPETSRDLNQACAVVGFFDYHDLWHILSSFALLMGAYLVLYISE